MRKKTKTTLLFVFASCLLYAQDSLKTSTLQEVVITGTRFEVPVEKSGKVIFSLRKSDLNRFIDLSDALNTVPGVQVDGAWNTPGTNLSYFIRGGRSENTLVLLDGVPMSDPTMIDNFYDLRFLARNQIQHVEVLQGALSSLYGTGASSAVINIQSATIKEDGYHGSIDLTAGSWNSVGRNLSISGKENRFSFQAFTNDYRTSGFSAADDQGSGGFDRDGFERRNAFLKVGYEVSKNLNLAIFSGYDFFDVEFDGGPFVDNENRNEQEQVRFGATVNWKYNRGVVNYIIQSTQNSREYFGSWPSYYDGGNFFSELTHQHNITDNLKIFSGISLQRLTYEERGALADDTTRFTMIDPYLSLFYENPLGLTVHAGLRVNNHSVYGAQTVYNVNPSWSFFLPNDYTVKLFTSISTSFLTPTLFQLNTPWGGNKLLRPEESLNREIGVSLYANSKFELTGVYFERDEENVIGYVVNEYLNLGAEREVQGATVAIRYSPIEALTIRADYSWVTSDDASSFLRIPGRKANVSAAFSLANSFTATVNYQFTGSRTDIYFDESYTSNNINLNSYHLFDISLAKTLFKEKLRVYAAVYNLFDHDFITAFGYTTRGRNFNGGITYTF